ncbi:glycosyltransferase [Flavobacterium sp. FlaQc-47]|uniref:glycosyltransferase n=1 Tax=Flavobacterium sp. FlaQc-47 TaxID=3374180 RepID=UPI0037582D66
MNQISLDFLKPMFPFLHFSHFRILVVNQTKSSQILNSEYCNIKVFNSFEKGLSKSRNLALENASGKILLVTDDDVVYQEGFIDKIIYAYNKFPNAVVINFCAVQVSGKLMKKYPSYSKKSLSIFDIFNSSSIEITLNKKIYEKFNIRFDENFGLGSFFEMGEEAVFLSDLKNEKLQLVFESEVIVKHQGLTSSNKKNAIEKYFIEGALATRIFGKNYIFWIFIKLFFDLKQYKLKFNQLNTMLKSSKNGHQKIQKLHENKE